MMECAAFACGYRAKPNDFQPPLIFGQDICTSIYIYIIYINTVRNLELSIFDCMFHRLIEIPFIPTCKKNKMFVR